MRRPEYETQAAFGTLCLNNNTESIAMVNDICNRYGLDTISTGSVVAFTIECYENGIITKKDTDGVELAAERIGKSAEKFAVHIGGQELGMHDPKLPSDMCEMPSARYLMDATPGRHTQDFGPSSFQNHILSAAGLCLFGAIAIPADKYITAYLRAVTGLNYTWNELLKAGERIVNMRHVFNLREGINELQWHVHPRIIGKPPFKKGPLAGVTADIEAQVYWNMGILDWDMVTAKPSKQKLLKLGLKDVVKDMYPE